MRKLQWTKWITWSVLAFCYAPILWLILHSLNASHSSSSWNGITLKWYLMLAQKRAVWEAAKNSLIVAISCALVATPIGTFSALAHHFCEHSKRLRSINSFLIQLVFLLPDLQIATGLLLFFACIKLNLGLFALFCSHTTFCIGYVMYGVLARLETLDRSLIEAAQDLGAKPMTIIRKVLFPLIRSSMFASAILACTISIDDFVLAFFLSGPTSATLPMEIYAMIRNGLPPLVSALSVLMLLVAFLSSWAFQYISKDNYVRKNDRK